MTRRAALHSSSDGTWALWRESIASQLTRSPFAEAWGEVSDLARDGQAFEHLHALTARHAEGRLSTFDPVELGAFKRSMRGLR